VIAVAGIMQISAVATLQWQTYEVTAFGVTASADFGLFKLCEKSAVLEICTSTSKDKEHKAAYRGAQATAILSILSMFGFIGTIMLLKVFLKKSTLIPIIVLGISTVLFSLATVIVYAAAIKSKKYKQLKLGASFYVSCVAIVLDIVGVVIHFIGYRYSAAESNVMA